MEILKDIVLEEAVKALAETGVLDLPTRRKLWEAMGPSEPREQDSSVPRALTEPLKKRAELALSCAKKVSRIWCTYDSEDKRPQNLIKQTRAYLDGKLSVEMLNAESDVIEDFMSIADDDGSDSAPAAAIAAWNALVVAMAGCGNRRRSGQAGNKGNEILGLVLGRSSEVDGGRGLPLSVEVY